MTLAYMQHANSAASLDLEREEKNSGKSNVAPAQPTAAELRGMIALGLCSFGVC
jgi:hypothetical protein